MPNQLYCSPGHPFAYSKIAYILFLEDSSLLEMRQV